LNCNCNVLPIRVPMDRYQRAGGINLLMPAMIASPNTVIGLAKQSWLALIN